MSRKWSVRWLALGGLALALGCRSTPGDPVITTPLLPETVVPGTAPPLPGGPPLPPAPIAGTVPSGFDQPPPLPPVPNANEPKLPSLPSPKPAGDAGAPVSGPDLPPVVPPKDVTSVLTSQTKPANVKPPDTLPSPVPGTRPPADRDEFGPAPVIMPAELTDTHPRPEAEAGPLAPPSPLKPGQQFGHGPDFRWVAGALDRHARGGYWTIRYADAGRDDEWGGKVRLMDDPRLRNFKNGDLVFVEGELLAPKSAAAVEGSAYPPYRITSVRLIEKGR